MKSAYFSHPYIGGRKQRVGEIMISRLFGCEVKNSIQHINKTKQEIFDIAYECEVLVLLPPTEKVSLDEEQAFVLDMFGKLNRAIYLMSQDLSILRAVEIKGVKNENR